MYLVIGLLCVLVVLALVAYFYLRGRNHEQFDQPRQVSVGEQSASDEHDRIVADMRATTAEMKATKGSRRMALFDEKMHELGRAVITDASFIPCNIDGACTAQNLSKQEGRVVSAEWVMAPGANPDWRLLYIHGGGFAIGSALSHRAITTELSSRLGMAVLAINYGLMPQHSRQQGILDCQNAYCWILDNGPIGQGACEKLLLAGDSAGGNLALMLLGWARDNDMRQVDAAIALSPMTDSTFVSPSLHRNLTTDIMLGPMLKPLAKVPWFVIAWGSALINKMHPANPLISPLHGDLQGLPPTLLQVSEAEVFYDEGVRYANKAMASGGVAVVQTWPHMLHVWHIFVQELPEAVAAFEHIEAFVSDHVVHVKTPVSASSKPMSKNSARVSPVAAENGLPQNS